MGLENFGVSGLHERPATDQPANPNNPKPYKHKDDQLKAASSYLCMGGPTSPSAQYIIRQAGLGVTVISIFLEKLDYILSAWTFTPCDSASLLAGLPGNHYMGH